MWLEVPLIEAVFSIIDDNHIICLKILRSDTMVEQLFVLTNKNERPILFSDKFIKPYCWRSFSNMF